MRWKEMEGTPADGAITTDAGGGQQGVDQRLWSPFAYNAYNDKQHL